MYYHYFRPISTVERKKIIESDKAIFRNDFLDIIYEDPVKGSWTMQLDSTKQIVKKKPKKTKKNQKKF